MIYLDFEKPLQELDKEIQQLSDINSKGKVNLNDKIEQLKKEYHSKLQELYQHLTPWQRVQVSRHPDRPYTLAYIDYISNKTFCELHGDRTVGDDKAMVGGLGNIDGQPVMFIGQQKGINTKMRQIRRFGMANPEGYRKALRLMKLAEKFKLPIVSFIDTPGAYPGLEAEERGQGEAIARNLFEMVQLKVPVICIIIGEGASGGALGIGIGDRVLMLENTWYSVISPESCSSILWRTWEHKEKAAEALKLTASDMMQQGLIDGIIKEPMGGAHRNPTTTFETVKKEILKHLHVLQTLSAENRIAQRIEKFSGMGVVHDLNTES
jgi:acetyl-CoA carboxylase carboxyl transferase subunit alpha